MTAYEKYHQAAVALQQQMEAVREAGDSNEAELKAARDVCQHTNDGHDRCVDCRKNIGATPDLRFATAYWGNPIALVACVLVGHALQFDYYGDDYDWHAGWNWRCTRCKAHFVLHDDRWHLEHGYSKRAV